MLVEIGSQLFVSVRLSFCLSDGLWPDRTDHLRDTRTARGPAGPRRIVGVVNPCPTEHCVEFESNKNQHMMSMHAFRQISNWTSSSSFEYFFSPGNSGRLVPASYLSLSCMRHTYNCQTEISSHVGKNTRACVILSPGPTCRTCIPSLRIRYWLQ